MSEERLAKATVHSDSVWTVRVTVLSDVFSLRSSGASFSKLADAHQEKLSQRPERKQRARLPTLSALLAIAMPGFFWPAPAWADDSAAMVMAANGFYTAYLSLPRGGGIPDATARAHYAPVLSPRLNQMINQAAAAEARFQAKNKNSPPLVEGDLFSSLFEGISSYSLSACTGDGKKGRCTASLTHTDPKQKPVSWTDTLLLVNTPSGWKVDDIAYAAGFSFGNSGNLTDTLKFVVSDAAQ